MTRMTKDEYYLNIAKAVSMRSTCLRRQYGAVIVKDDIIIATGYNGAARGEQNCTDAGECWREAHGVPHGQQYEKCRAVHAEDNAISQAGYQTIGATLYLWGGEHGKQIKAVPCEMCSRKIKNARIARIVASEEKSAVNHPAHYNIPGRKECIEEMLDKFGPEKLAAFCELNAYKYRYRHDLKGGEEDIQKAEWYENKLKELNTVSKWIPISDKEPPMYKQTLVTDGGNIDFGYYQGDGYFCFSEELVENGEVTHWMPLPELPKE